MPGYFNYFPTTNFNNNLATNLLAKIKFDQSVIRNLAVFYNYNIKQGERADQIASKYYEDPLLDWLIYLANDITDPYLEWYLTQEQFIEFIKEKYGSVEKAQEKIAFYRNNYKEDDTILSTTQYGNLSYLVKKYYRPVIGLSNNIVSYVRKELDQVLENNKVVVLNVGAPQNFIEEEKITQGNVFGFVSQVGSNSLTITKVTGTFSNTANVVGSDSNTTSNVTIVNVVSQPINVVESSFWEAVSYYKYEEELNESRSIIRILDKSYVGKIEKDIRELFR